MDLNKHSPYCLDLLNEIHANRAVRHLSGGKAFKHNELIAICKSVGDMPTWDEASQARLLADTLSAMADRDPYIEDEG